LEQVVHWPAWLVPKVVRQLPGERRRLFELPNKTEVAVLICWENLFSDFVRGAVREGARLLVQLTNDNWFGRTAAPRQHNLASVLRAVENRVPVMIASNTGPSEIIDPFGRVVGGVPESFGEGLAVAEVSLGTGGTVYGRCGNLLAHMCIAVVLAGIPAVIVRAQHDKHAMCLEENGSLYDKDERA
jgi:apolipoprotein N-acyltransferase